MVMRVSGTERAQFRSKFEDDLPAMHGTMGLGIISDYEDQPLVVSSHLGTYAIVTVGKVHNLEQLTTRLLGRNGTHFTQIRDGEINPTELVTNLIDGESTFEDGISHAQSVIDGSCSLLILDDKGILAARDRLGRTPVAIGRKDGAHAATMETSALPNLGYELEHVLGPGEVVRITADGIETLTPPGNQSQVCSFLWIYYGYPASCYEGINVEACRNRCGAALARADDVEVDYVAGIPDSGIGHAIGYAAEARTGSRRQNEADPGRGADRGQPVAVLRGLYRARNPAHRYHQAALRSRCSRGPHAAGVPAAVALV